MVQPRVFIDGEAGTTGLQIYSRLAQRQDVTVVSIDPAKRKDVAERARLIDSVDLAILCLPDAAALEVVAQVSSPTVKILDASTAHRTDPDWVYGFPELAPGQRQAIATSHRVSNPGCYPTGFLAAIKPLVSAGLLPASFPVTINAISGYSGGGRKMMEAYAGYWGEPEPDYPYGVYGLTFGHKHVQEMHKYSGLDHTPLFLPAVGAFEQGMLVQMPLPLWTLENPPTGQQLHDALAAYYADAPFIQVHGLGDVEGLRDRKFLDTKAANGTNQVQLFVFANDDTHEALIAARLDNLGKGASGAAVQNMNLMLGLPESRGL
ncbi:N-acetyl-gamma-glutamyl-phosphate reductase [Leptolyngbya cf. ectocarpi LEGE 11479]|uniref:N-acetyl-gamma-glutamyl-phosphate reductase n=1 Tax=Leptolyngbya cf. ectocarpi LEGE 11479 TaxID=1828722 RepID=A0A928ZQQ6_LEPEC|nr:N-acetyl-gamma-glutamyl-phosphate reductase [Leptolyngbya ectocarpi]MBE9066490.1 N-acetyl-gamma-glutamyl-phosphate reductase [Leptolyngbya cf. ectocarpi LEGE 11479]